MKFKKILILLFIIITVSCGLMLMSKRDLIAEINDDRWAYSQAVLVCENRHPDGQCYFKLTYNAPESTAVNKSGQQIKGPIDQTGAFDKQPVNDQVVKIKYLKEEPAIFNYVDEIRWAE